VIRGPGVRDPRLAPGSPERAVTGPHSGCARGQLRTSNLLAEDLRPLWSIALDEDTVHEMGSVLRRASVAVPLELLCCPRLRKEVMFV